MISHDNLIFNASQFSKYLKLSKGSEKFIAYLPFFHIAAQFQLFLSLSSVGQTNFAPPDAIRGEIFQVLIEIQPTFFIGVPRIFEKIIEFERTGLENAKTIISGAAPINKKCSNFLKSKNILTRNGYGATEWGTPFISSEGEAENVGKTYEGVEVKIINENSYGEGEICIRGRNVFLGYLNDIQKTKETLDDDGWFYTGDMGKFDSEGNLIVTGRTKEMIITSNGEKNNWRTDKGL